MRPSRALENYRELVREAVSRRCEANPRVFGSVLYGADRDDSDIDILVDALPGATLFDLGGLQMKLQEILGVRVDLLTPKELPRQFREQALREAAPI
jgi:predicted nucleotidyltransferase